MTTALSVTMPQPHKVGDAERSMHAAVEAEKGFAVFRTTTTATGWPCHSGFAVISEWDIARDGEPLFAEGPACSAPGAAVFALAGNERAAEIALPNPVDDVTHAMLASRRCSRA